MKKYILSGWMILLLSFHSCNSFLEEYSQDLTYARTAADLDEILVGDGYMKIWEYNTLPALGSTEGPYFPWIHVMDDDITEFSTGSSAPGAPSVEFCEFYLWGSYPFIVEGQEKEDTDWKRLYKHISTINVLLSKTEEINDFPEEIERIKGECHFLRGVYYFYLVNFYAKPYVKATAATDPGVPLKTTEYIEDIYFSRSSLQETYEQILGDLTTAAALLKGKKHKTVYRAGYHAVQAFLSRVYLYMEDYESALRAADTVLQGKYDLVDYNELRRQVIPDEYGTINGVSVTWKDSPETIFSQGGNTFMYSYNAAIMGSAYNYNVSESLLEAYRQEPGTDLREGNWLGIHTDSYDSNIRKAQKLVDTKDGMVSSECLIRLPEVLLNKAEALALLSREGEAMDIVEELRVKRISNENYVALDRRTGEALVRLIRDERRRELCFEGHRWFDLRRYAVHSKYPWSEPIIHDHYYFDQTNYTRAYLGSCKLEKYESEPAYVIPVPRAVIEFNQGNVVANPDRPQREMFNRF